MAESKSAALPLGYAPMRDETALSRKAGLGRTILGAALPDQRMTYRAPVADIAFALKHAAGLRAGAGRGPLRRPRRGRGRCGAGGSRPLRDRGDRAAQPDRRPPRHAVQGRRRHHAAGLEGGLSRLGGGRLERARRAGAMGRPGAAARAQRRLHRDVELGRHGVRPRAGADHGRASMRSPRTAATSSSAPISPKLVSGEWMGTMQLTEPQAGSDVGALAHQGRARRRRQLPHHRPENLHHLWRARSHRQHHPFGAGAAAGRAGRHARHLAVPGAEIPGQRRRLARRAQRRARPFDRAQARHPRLAHLHHGLRRPGRRHRLPRRRGEPRHGLHVHHDEPGAARGRPAGRRPSPSARRSRRSPMRASASRAAPTGAKRRRRCRRSSRIPTSSACC